MTARRPARLALGLLAVAGATGCGDSVTQLIVVTDTDLAVPGEIDEVALTFVSEAGTMEQRRARFAEAGAPSLPLHVSVLPAADAPVTVTAVGLLRGAAVVTAVARTSVGAGETAMVRLLLLRDCAGAACGPMESCGASGCAGIDVTAEPWPGTPPGFDGGMAPPESPEPGAPQDLATGAQHGCVVDDRGHVFCWGQNENGQLGDGTRVTRSRPVWVAGVEEAVEVAAGDFHTCARVAGGGVRCWGSGMEGGLGPGHPGVTTAAVEVDLMDRAAQSLAVGGGHTCAVVAGGNVFCFGRNNHGQLGGVSGEATPTPRMVEGLASALEISAGRDHTCAVVGGGAVLCWGRNDRGQLGDGTTAAPGRAVTVELGGVATDVACGSLHTCAVMDDGRVLCWGFNGDDQLGLGDGGPTQQTTPAAVVDVAGASRVTAGDGHTCVLLEDGVLRCWGRNNRGQIGDGTTDDRAVAVPVPGISNLEQVEAGTVFTCARRFDGPVSCWGDNGGRQLGNGSSDELRATPGLIALGD